MWDVLQFVEKKEDILRMNDQNKAKSMFSPYSSADPSMHVPGLFPCFIVFC